MPPRTTTSLPPGLDLSQLTALLRSLEKTCARIDHHLQRLEQLPEGQGSRPSGKVGQAQECKPWCLFEAAPELAEKSGLNAGRTLKKIPAQPLPELPAGLEQRTLARLNLALGAAFSQVVHDRRKHDSAA